MAAAGQVFLGGLSGSGRGITLPRRRSAHPPPPRSRPAARQRRLRSQHTGVSVLAAMADDHERRGGDAGAWGDTASSLRARMQRGVGGAAVGAALLLDATLSAPCLAVEVRANPLPPTTWSRWGL